MSRSFRRRIFAVSHLHWYWQTRTTKWQHVQNTNQCNPQNGNNKQQYTTLKNLG